VIRERRRSGAAVRGSTSTLRTAPRLDSPPSTSCRRSDPRQRRRQPRRSTVRSRARPATVEQRRCSTRAQLISEQPRRGSWPEALAHDSPGASPSSSSSHAAVNIEDSSPDTPDGGKKVLPHGPSRARLRSRAGHDYDRALAQLKAHLASRGFGDIEVSRAAGTTRRTPHSDATDPGAARGPAPRGHRAGDHAGIAGS